MNKQEAEDYAGEMTYADAINNALRGKSIPFKRATRIKLRELIRVLNNYTDEREVDNASNSNDQ